MQITNSSQAGNDEGRGEINRRVSSPSLSRAVLIGWTKSAGRAIPSLVAVQRRKEAGILLVEDVPTNFKQDQLVDCEADAHWNRSFDPIHGQALVQAPLHSFLSEYRPKCRPTRRVHVRHPQDPCF